MEYCSQKNENFSSDNYDKTENTHSVRLAQGKKKSVLNKLANVEYYLIYIYTVSRR